MHNILRKNLLTWLNKLWDNVLRVYARTVFAHFTSAILNPFAKPFTICLNLSRRLYFFKDSINIAGITLRGS